MGFFLCRVTGDMHLPNGNVFALEEDGGVEVFFHIEITSHIGDHFVGSCLD